MQQSISRFSLAGKQRVKQVAREALGQTYNAAAKCELNRELLPLLSKTTLGSLDRKVKHGQDLTFEEAFCGMCYVLAATNNRLFDIFRPLIEGVYGTALTHEKSIALGSAFLNLMAVKEALSTLTAEEIAGVVTASLMDSVFTFDLNTVMETCGMGGDKGLGQNGVVAKSINVSTLSSVLLSSLGIPIVKHGSYGNSSLVGSTDAIERFGVRTTFAHASEAWQMIRTKNYCYFDAHLSKTLHDLSHLLMMETINHIIGPMTPPISAATRINKVFGVNEKVHPATAVAAYNLLHAKGKQNVGGVIAVAGLDDGVFGIDPSDHALVRKHVILDELSPYSSIIAIGCGPNYYGSYTVTPATFGIEVDPAKIIVPNDKTAIQEANVEALTGKNSALADYLAMNAALGLYLHRQVADDEGWPTTGPALLGTHLRDCFQICRKAIDDGEASQKMWQLVNG